MAQIARETGLGQESLYKALSPEGNPEFATVLKVVRALGLRLRATQRKHNLNLCWMPHHLALPGIILEAGNIKIRFLLQPFDILIIF